MKKKAAKNKNILIIVSTVIIITILFLLYFILFQSNAFVNSIYSIFGPISKTYTAETCKRAGGSVVNRLGNDEYPCAPEHTLGEVVGMRCPCVCCKEVID